MLIGVISDTHIPERAKDIPKAVMEEFSKVDMIIHAGDLVVLKVLDRLKEACSDVRVVCGNMDDDDIRRMFPEKEVFQAEGRKIALMHGHGHPSQLLELMKREFKHEHPDMVIFGHSHSAFNEERDGIIYFNPGSPTDTVFATYRSYGIIKLEDKKIEPRIVRI